MLPGPIRLFCLAAIAATSVLAEIPPATDTPKPLSPEEAIQTFQLPDDVRVELVASEPLVAEPSAIAFDEQGRLFVGELHGYNLEGFYDVQELNRTGMLDFEVRRVRVEGEALQRARREAVGVIKVLHDDNADGRMDRADVWADDLPPCYGLVCARDGLVAVCPPKILFLADRDRDGRAELRETLFEGFAFELLERGINSPRRGPDNWIYIAAGGGGGEITGPRLRAPVRIGHSDFRIQDDGTAIEPVTGTCGTFGMALTDFGERFIITTSRHALYAVPLEYRHLLRNPYVPSPDGTASAADYDRIYPASEPDPWRVARNADPAWVAFYGSRETAPNGYFTGACGPLIYRGETLPDRYRGNHFCCEPANNLVHRSIIERDGAGFRARRAPGEETSEFLTSTDRWFRPIHLAIGPDGALYIVDFYREIIEDYSAIPRHLQQRYMESLRAGHDYGRIWRVTAKNGPKYTPADWRETSSERLVAALDNENPWVRETAQRLLIARKDESVAPLLARMVETGGNPAARLHAIHSLDALGRLTPRELARALRDESYGVRVHALRLAERWMNEDPGIRHAAIRLATEPDPSVRLQAAQSLGECRHAEAVDALAEMARRFGDERWMAAAILSASAQDPVGLLERLAAREEFGSGVMAVLGPLAATVAARGESNELHQLLAMAEAIPPAEVQEQVLDGLLAGLARGARAPLGEGPGDKAVARLLAHPSGGVRERALRVASVLGLADSPAMRAAWDEALDVSLRDTAPLDARLAAVRMLSAAPWEKCAEVKALLRPSHPPELQLAAVHAIGGAREGPASAVLLDSYPSMSPKIQEAILDALFANRDGLPAVLDAIESGTIPARAIPPLRRVQLFESGDAETRERATMVLRQDRSAERRAILGRYKEALHLERDTKRGQQIFQERCAECHLLRGEGHPVGPELSAVRLRPDETLLADVLDPSGVITAGYTAYLVSTVDRELYTGTLGEETATSVTLRRAKGETHVVLRRDIAEMRALTVSLMPEGIEQTMTVQDMADLLGFLRSAGGTLSAPGIILFDDAPEFVAALTHGSGTAELCVEQPFSGVASLRVTRPQRHSPNITGWRYPIVENPVAESDHQVESFRYLRLAWKAEGEGVMIELAADGQWPPAQEPTRRYYSGANMTGWQALQIAKTAPREWTTLTVDLWKDFGQFTLTGIAPTAIGGAAYFDRIELLKVLDDSSVLAMNTNDP